MVGSVLKQSFSVFPDNTMSVVFISYTIVLNLVTEFENENIKCFYYTVAQKY